jgi:transcriptional regulator with XRE-family HTH domain
MALDDVLKDLGRRIAELRAAQELTQEQLAERAEMTVQYLQRVESGRENLTVKSLLRFGELLDATIMDLFARPASREARTGRPRRKPAI